MKTYLHVPFEAKDRARNLGARWDDARGQWFVPDGVDLAPFVQWVPVMPKLSAGVRKILLQRVR